MTSETVDGDRRAYRQLVVAGTVGNVMEWNDFAVYGYFVRPISQAFFPAYVILAAAVSTAASLWVRRPDA